MTREIKFRAWVAKEKTYNSIRFMLGDDGNVYDTTSINPEEWHSTDDVILEQYTGLNDKNGKEIYEGDIIRYDAIDYAVVWTEFYACFEALRINNSYEYSLNHIARFSSVIGNIHENPELLEEAA